MTRTITCSLSLFSLLVFILSSCSDSMYSGKHYGRNMYVKADRHKTEALSNPYESRAQAATGMASLPELNIKRLGSAETKPIAKKLDATIAKVFPAKHKSPAKEITQLAKSVRYNTAQFVQTVNITKPETTAADTGSALFTILIVIGAILLILGIIALILEIVGIGGWLGLILAGLLIILLAYFVFNNV